MLPRTVNGSRDASTTRTDWSPWTAPFYQHRRHNMSEKPGFSDSYCRMNCTQELRRLISAKSQVICNGNRVRYL